jgi:hypothetical protein
LIGGNARIGATDPQILGRLLIGQAGEVIGVLGKLARGWF